MFNKADTYNATVGIVYFTHSDITGELANAAAQAIQSQGVSSILYRVKGEDIVDGRYINAKVFKELKDCDAIIFASPTYMGGPSAQFKAFVDATSGLWESQRWSGKIAAGITSGNSANGDQSSTLHYFSVLAGQHGMIWVGLDEKNKGNNEINRFGCQFGVVAQGRNGQPDDVDLNTAKHLGTRIANMILNDYHNYRYKLSYK